METVRQYYFVAEII